MKFDFWAQSFAPLQRICAASHFVVTSGNGQRNKAKCVTESAHAGKSRKGVVAQNGVNQHSFVSRLAAQQEKELSDEDALIRGMEGLYVTKK